MNRIARSLVAITTILGPSQASLAEEPRYKLDYLLGKNEIVAYFFPQGTTPQCTSVDMSQTTPDLAARHGWRLFAKSFFDTSTVGYVYWVSVPSAGHRVFTASYFLEGCALRESRTDEKAFVGETTFDDAKAYYTELLRGYFAP
jgi:hypothetical protein